MRKAIIEIEESITHHVSLNVDGILDEDVFDYAEEQIDDLIDDTIDKSTIKEIEVSVIDVIDIKEEQE